MGHQRDMRIERQARARKASCVACAEIDHEGLSYQGHVIAADRIAIYLEIAARLRATGERGSEVAALLVEQLADEVAAMSAAGPGTEVR